MGSSLRFRKDGTFKIVQFTDTHWQNGEAEDQLTRSLMERVLKAERPDLIVFTGDLIFSLHCRDPLSSVREVVSAAAESGIPWAAVLGNHDAEEGCGVSREAVLRELMAAGGSVTGHEPGIGGWGNYDHAVLGVDGKPAASLYFLDSGDYSRVDRIPGYGWIGRDQTEWYLSRSAEHRKLAGGEPLPSLAFFHIPLPEYNAAWESGSCSGNKHERVCCAEVNGGFFAAMAEAGDVIGTFCGHDHINDYSGEWLGIRLSYGRASGYATYGREGFQRGARVIRLTEGSREFESWLRLEDGTVERQRASEALDDASPQHLNL
ncbi:metallophosphoesterase family protein [Paenibacillus sp. P22]|uniref:metallophosphoesterase family protein n=1 Tax=Paenibacillus sp. P22 TaxID=483908 RepID=UPI00040E4384|nr:metallophosphoesterase family protein [Paenibacillus sp. P22]